MYQRTVPVLTYRLPVGGDPPPLPTNADAARAQIPTLHKVQLDHITSLHFLLHLSSPTPPPPLLPGLYHLRPR